MMIEIILRNRRIPYKYNSYLNEMKKMRSLLSNRTNTNNLIESIKVKSVYQSAFLIAQEISFQLRNKKRSFHSIFSKIVKDIQLRLISSLERSGVAKSYKLRSIHSIIPNPPLMGDVLNAEEHILGCLFY
ncbi:ribosomal protein S3, mitochondrial-like [Mercurialis annua]|uniref:ribosomal protein S3, mitochondrial-like n=1 Tax=Mercurialis annua TaxID=3986 RepID=UPI0021601151|nr:ribosomal protein S3, mitochondrial-like [Mercurialis annua]